VSPVRRVPSCSFSLQISGGPSPPPNTPTPTPFFASEVPTRFPLGALSLPAAYLICQQTDGLMTLTPSSTVFIVRQSLILGHKQIRTYPFPFFWVSFFATVMASIRAVVSFYGFSEFDFAHFLPWFLAATGFNIAIHFFFNFRATHGAHRH